MTFVLIRGTSGSGKTWIAERVIERLGGLDAAEHIKLGAPAVDPGKWRVGAYAWPNVTLIGRYSGLACGGADTLNWKNAAEDVERFAWQQYDDHGRHTLIEGLTASSYGVERLVRLNKACGVVVVALSTPLKDCLEAIRQRRLAAGNDKPLNPNQTTLKYNVILTKNKTNRQLGVPVEIHDRASAHDRVMELLGL
jgi:predicted kinase